MKWEPIEIEPGDPTGLDTAKIACGLFCMSEADAFSPRKDQLANVESIRA